MQLFVGVFIGGGLGSLLRYMLSRSITGNFTHINPVGTFVANLLSTILLGVVLYLATTKFQISDLTRTFVIVGFCGGFSTFSTFSYETFELFRSGNLLFAFANIVVSIVLGVGVLYFLSKTI
jgi:CrcB protein